MSPKNPSSLNRYAELQPLIRKEAEDIARRVFDEQAKKLRFSAFDIPNHTHNGLDSPRISQKDIHPGVSASGSIRMITSGQRYTLGLTFNPTQLLLYGNAVHRTGGNIDIRAQIIGNANFGKSYYFRPQSANSVKSGGTYQNVIQSGSYIAVDNVGTVTTSATEGHLVQVLFGGNIVAEATIPNTSTVSFAGGEYTNKGYGAGFVYVDVYLASGWEINANFVVM